MTGATLGPYRVLDKLGEGGMGQVYRARDTRLHRDVAVKVLSEAFAADADRVARFEREAHALAALNHPNIAHVYDAGRSDDGRAFIAMEFVAGEDLSARIRRGAVPLDEALEIARQVALALEAAHAAGIIHRDLKPANIKVTADGTVKVLDFGLARMNDAARDDQPSSAANSPTMTSPARMRQADGTELGVILGTAAYMSPEQARGRSVDKRADIWAFGGVLYEMLCGVAAFGGDTVTDVIAAVITKEPDWTRLPAGVPARVRSVLKGCLRKDPKQRVHDIADARLALDAADENLFTAASRTTAGAETRPRRLLVPILTTALVALALGVAAGNFWRASQETPAVDWSGARIGGPPIALKPRLSPDGHMLAFITVANQLTQIAVMKPGMGSWAVVTRDRTHGLAFTLNWSANGSLIYYDRHTDAPQGIYSVPTFGGEERLVIENAESPAPLPDGSILCGKLNAERLIQLHRFWADSGKLEPLPVVTPGLKRFSGRVRAIDANRIAVFGHPLADRSAPDALYILNLTTHELQRIGGDYGLNVVTLTVDRTDKSVVASVLEGNMFRIVRVGTDARAVTTSLMTMLSRPDVDIAPNGTFYIGLDERSNDVIRFAESGGAAELLASDDTFTRGLAPLPDGGALTPSVIGAQSRLFSIASGKEPVRLAQTDEPTTAPMTAVAGGRAAFFVGPPGAQDLAVADVATGRILRRHKMPQNVQCLGASSDGATLYISSDGTISAVDTETGSIRKIGAGDSFVVDPDSGDLVVKLDEVTGYRLVRVPASGGAPAPIVLHSDGNFSLVPNPLTPGSIRRGKLVLPIASRDSWNWFAGVLDLKSGQLQKVTLNRDTDVHLTTWDSQGRILAYVLGTSGRLWKFTPQKAAARQ